MGVVYFSIIPTFEPSRYCKCWIVCFHDKNQLLLAYVCYKLKSIKDSIQR